MTFQSFLPSPLLRPYIKVFVHMEAKEVFNNIQTDRFLPLLGAGLTFFFYKKRPVIFNSPSSIDFENPIGYISSVSTNSVFVTNQGGYSLISLLFNPGMFRHFFPFSASEFCNMNMAFGDANEATLKLLHEQMSEVNGIRDRIQLLENWLIKKLQNKNIEKSEIDYSIELIHLGKATKVKDLSKMVHKSTRQFRRKFQIETGFTPKQYLRINRFLRAFSMLKSSSKSQVSDVSYKLGYFDPSHFASEFKHFAGQTPAKVFSEEQFIRDATFWRDFSTEEFLRNDS